MAIIFGSNGSDSINGTAEPDSITAGAGDDSIRGGAGNDTINGEAGNDLLDGGLGTDSLVGGAGNDVYFVDDNSDVVVEGAGAFGDTGDTVLASNNYALSLGAQIETLGYRAAPSATGVLGADGIASDTTTIIDVNLSGNEFAQRINGTAGKNLLIGGRNANATQGDTLDGGAGDDTFVVMNPNDLVIGGAGVDTVFVSVADLLAQGQTSASYSLQPGNTDIEVLSAQNQSGTQSLSLTGSGQGGQKIIGNFGSNTLNGGGNGLGGAGDTLIGLDGDDTYVINNILDRIDVETGGVDTLTFSAGTAIQTYNVGATLGADVSLEVINLVSGVTNITGNNIAQRIVGTSTGATNGTGIDETLNGGAGADTLQGNGGNDTYVVDVAGDVITEVAGTSPTTDTVLISGTTGYDLAAGLSIEVMAVHNNSAGNNGARLLNTAAASGVFLVGNELSQTIIGAGGDDILNGDRGTSGNLDVLLGGNGSDTYRVYSQDDVVSEITVLAVGNLTDATTYNTADAGGTNDTVFTSANFSLTTNAAKLIVAGVAAGGGIETLSAADHSSLTGLSLQGFTNDNTIIGTAGNDTIDGAGGSDRMIGFGGDDIYEVDTIAVPGGVAGDVIIEGANGGNDTANVNVSGYVLNAGASVETLNLTGTFGVITGNSLAQFINGNASANTITGGGGADTLAGGGSVDLYVVSDSQTVIIDSDGLANTINIASGPGYDIAEGVSIGAMTATGTGDMFLVGNSGVQTLTGNAGNNILNGSGGVSGTAGDTLVGGDGSDTYRVFTSNYTAGSAGVTNGVGDVVTETNAAIAGGNDTVFTSVNYVLSANVENLVAADANLATNITLVGNGLANQISGSAGNNVLYGAAGNDTLTGLGGKDTFHFDEVGAADADTIADFSSAQGDKISLDSDGAFAALQNNTAGFQASEFTLGTTATTANAQIIYDQATGRLFYDADGTGAGAAQLFAQLQPGTALSASDFVLNATIPNPQA